MIWSQEFFNNVIDLVQQKWFYAYEYMGILKSWKKNYLEKLLAKNMHMLLMFGKEIEMKTMKDYHDLYLKCDILLCWCVWKI